MENKHKWQRFRVWRLPNELSAIMCGDGHVQRPVWESHESMMIHVIPVTPGQVMAFLQKENRLILEVWGMVVFRHCCGIITSIC